MKKFRTIIIILVALLGLQFFKSCCKSDYVPLTADEVKWAPYYLNQNIIFINDLNDTDTLIVSNFIIEDIDDHNGDGCEMHWEQLSCNIKWIKDTTISLIRIRISEEKVMIYVNGNSAIYDLRYDKFTARGINDEYLKNISIKNINYSNVIHLNSSPHYITDKKIKELYFGKSIGIIMYKDGNDIIWYKK